MSGWLELARRVVDDREFVVVGLNGEQVPTEWGPDPEDGTETVVNDNGVLLDLQTAWMLTQVHDALSPKNAARFAAMPLERAVDTGWLLVRRSHGEG